MLLFATAVHCGATDVPQSPSFSSDVLPILRNNCIACHNAKQTEGGLNLESVDGILAGGDSGEMVSVAMPSGSLLLARAKGEVDSIMPPEDNSVGAKQLSESELVILEKWIAAGAKQDSQTHAENDVGKPEWQPLPENLRSVFAMSPSPTQPVVAVGRGNTITLVDTASGEIVDQLFDNAIASKYGAKAAHVDFVNSLAFSPEGDRLVSGGYRTLKVWRKVNRPEPLGKLDSLVAGLVKKATTEEVVSVSDEQRQKVSEWWKAVSSPAAKTADELELLRWQDNQRRATEQSEFLKGQVGPATERVTKEVEAKKKAEEAHAKKVEELTQKKSKVDEVSTKVEALKAADPATPTDQVMAAEKELEAAKGAVDAAEKELAALAQAVASATDVHQRAVESLDELNAEVAANASELERLQQQIDERTNSVNQKSISAIGFNDDHTLFAAAISDGSIMVFDASSGKAATRLFSAPIAIERLLVIDRWVIALAPKETPEQAPVTRVWNLADSWELERVIGSPDGESPFADRITALDFSPDGELLVVGGGEPSRTGIVTVLDTSDFSIKSSWENNHSDIVLCLKVSPDGKKLASAGADKQIRIVDFPTGEGVRSLEGHTHHVLGVAWQDHGRRLASVSADHTVKVWNVRAGEAERTINGGGKELSGVAFIGLTSQIAVSSGEGAVRVYNTDNGGQVRAYNNVHGYQQAVAADPLGSWVAAGSTDGSLRVWPIEAVEPRIALD